MRRRSVLPLCAALTSCVVGSFEIRDQLPGEGAAGTNGSSGSAGSGTSGASSGSSSAGSGNETGGDAQGGQGPQGGSAALGGQAAGGETTTPEGGAAGESNGGPDPALPCDVDEVGTPPILCDAFESIGNLDVGKWESLAGIAPETASGPYGSTGIIHLSNARLKAKVPVDLKLVGSGTSATISFWAKTAMVDSTAKNWVDFGTATNPTVWLSAEPKGLAWRSVQNISAPTVLSGTGIVSDLWHCVSIYLTPSTMTVSYSRAGAAVTTFVVDQQPTANVDAEWLTQTADFRTIATFIGLGSDPLDPADLSFDDLRIVRGKTNVCGF